MDKIWLLVVLVTILILPSLLLILLHGLLLRQVVVNRSDLVAFYQFRLLSFITGVFMVCWWPLVVYMLATSIDPLLDSIAVYWAQVILKILWVRKFCG